MRSRRKLIASRVTEDTWIPQTKWVLMQPRKQTKSLVAAVVIAAAALLPSIAAAPTFAATPRPTNPPINVQDIEAHATALGIPQSVQASLLAKVQRGEQLDSMSGAKPVSVTTSTAAGVKRTTQTFADGSYVIDTAQIPKPAVTGEVTPMSVTGCTNGQGAGRFPFWNCRIATDQFLFSIDFYMDGYKGSSGSWYGSITRVYNLGYWTGAASVNSTSLRILTANQSASGPAKAQAQLNVTFIGGSGSGVYRLSGYVSYGNIYDTSP
jgi:hypothetical protein